MGLLDGNKVLTREQTGLEGTDFNLVISNDTMNVWEWSKKDSQKNLRVTFRDIYVWSDDYMLYMVKGKITDTPTAIEVNTTNFPNLRAVAGGSLPRILKVIACPCGFTYHQDTYKWGNVRQISGENCRIVVIFSNGQLYHNYPACYNDADFYNPTWAIPTSTKPEDLFTKFDESVVWDLPGRKHPVKTNTGDDAALIATGAYYYNPALPDCSYEMHPAIGAANGYGNTDGFAATNSVNNISSGENIGTRARFWRTNIDDVAANNFNTDCGYALDNQSTIIGTFAGNIGEHPTRVCVFGSQDGGRSWYAMYEFSGKERVKVGTSYNGADGTIGVPLAQEGSASAGVYNLKRRTIIVPSSTDKEPSTLFEYNSAINISSISGTSSAITITTASAHGLSKGDCVVIGLQENESLANRTFDWMVNSSADGTTGGNGILFVVSSVISSTEITLSQYIWNTNNNLPIKHIHALERCKDGVSISCGEGYPYGGWLIYNVIRLADGFAGYNVAKSEDNKFIRLNSTEYSFQRPTGFIIQQEGKDTYLYFGCDHEYTPMNDVEMPEGRTETFKHNSCGIWKCKVSEIDSQKDNGMILYPSRQNCYSFRKYGSAFVFTGEFGLIGVSFDNGETWEVVQLPPSCAGQYIVNHIGMTDDGKFSINNVLVQLKK